MYHYKAVLIALACAALGGCANPDAVLFVTDTSVGIDVTGKPPSASISYDRTEGYFGPQYPNGAIPPVVASLQVGGTVFSPRIRQVYATGPAAVIASGSPAASAGPTQMVGPSGERKLAFIGTSTTLGLKVGFDGAAAYPDTFLFGYKRREVSFIPLGSTTVGGVTTDAYPSALASIDSHTNTAGLNNTGLDSVQFFATGTAAEALAGSDAVRNSFSTMAAATATLAGQDRQAAIDAGTADHAAYTTHLDAIFAKVSTGGALDTAKWTALIDKANTQTATALDPPLSNDLKLMTSEAQVRARLAGDQVDVTKLYNALN